MSAFINDGGPAFPSPMQDDRDCAPRHASGYGGMTLRDWFAGQFLCSGRGVYFVHQNGQKAAAELAYKVADAMIAARGKGGAA